MHQQHKSHEYDECFVATFQIAPLELSSPKHSLMDQRPTCQRGTLIHQTMFLKRVIEPKPIDSDNNESLLMEE